MVSLKNSQNFEENILLSSGGTTPVLQNTCGRLLLSLLVVLYRSFMNIQKESSGVLQRGVLINFTKFTGKQLCQIFVFNKIVGLSLQLYQNETLAQVLSCEFYEVSKNTFVIKKPLVAASEYPSYHRLSFFPLLELVDSWHVEQIIEYTWILFLADLWLFCLAY